jgi:hypothetical protein
MEILHFALSRIQNKKSEHDSPQPDPRPDSSCLGTVASSLGGLSHNPDAAQVQTSKLANLLSVQQSGTCPAVRRA